MSAPKPSLDCPEAGILGHPAFHVVVLDLKLEVDVLIVDGGEFLWRVRDEARDVEERKGAKKRNLQRAVADR